jgi:oligoribonuclease
MRPESSTYSANNLVWIDMEMTGLQPEADRILEVAVLVTDSQLNILAESPVWVLHQPDEVLEAMDSWNRATHAKTGLIERVKASTLAEAQAEAQALDFLAPHVPANASPMCGNSICQDRRFLARWMPRLEAYFHYRNLDVSTLKELARRWKPELAKGFTKEGKHEALADILESIEELRFYRRTVMSI